MPSEGPPSNTTSNGVCQANQVNQLGIIFRQPSLRFVISAGMDGDNFFALKSIFLQPLTRPGLFVRPKIYGRVPVFGRDADALQQIKGAINEVLVSLNLWRRTIKKNLPAKGGIADSMGCAAHTRQPCRFQFIIGIRIDGQIEVTGSQSVDELHFFE